MPLRRSEKEDVIGKMAERLGRAGAIVVTDYRGLNVAQFEELRTKLREAGSEIAVVKNSLLRRAMAQAEISAPDELLRGPTAVAFLYDDLSRPAKVLREAVKSTEILTIKGGLMGATVMDARAVGALADLPTREELLASFLSVLQAPQRNLVTVLSAPMRNLLNVLNARVSEAGAG
jgi:large subunit ribosomal protein L10